MASVQPNGIAHAGPPPAEAGKKKKSRGQMKRLKQRAKKAAASDAESATTATDIDTDSEVEADARRPTEEQQVAPSLVDEILQETAEGADPADPQLSAFKDVFAKFKVDLAESADAAAAAATDAGPLKPAVIYSDEDASSEGSDAEAPAPSKRKQRKANRLSVAELKRLVKRPELVEWVDVSAPDPRLLLAIKSHRNVVPIPQHWSAKRDYLQSKRGLEKPPFQLPSYIADTGIATQRDAVKEKEDGQSLKQKTRERVQPKMGKIDIDYQKLHDAFFKYQTAPRMTHFGEMYYEGKEFETDLRNKRPGELSKELIEALSIPPLAPPPWLIAMQRYGPPPSYPHLKIQGLNAPIPHGASWGFHPGGWGQPMMDEFNRPVYPAVLGTEEEVAQAPAETGEPIVRESWGQIVDEYEEEDEEEEEEEEEEPEPDQDVDMSGAQTGLVTPSGAASVSSTVPDGLETPDFLELRKQRSGTESVSGGPPRQLYQVIDERKADQRGSFMGSERQYDLSGGTPSLPVLGQEERRGKRKQGDVDLALDPSQLEGMTEQQLRDKYEASRRASGAGGQGSHEDLQDFAAAEVAKRRKRAEHKGREKEKEKFKF